MKQFYQPFSLLLAMIATTSWLSGCEEESAIMPTHTASTVIQQVRTIEPSATSAQIIGIYRSIFIDNLARAERGIERLASQQAATQMPNQAPNSSASSAFASTASTTSDLSSVSSASASTTRTSSATSSTNNDKVSAILLQEDLPPDSERSMNDITTASEVAGASLSPMATIDSDKAGIRYDAAMKDLYSDSPLTTEVYDTIVDITVFAPEVFEDHEINQRLQYHSPALARMVNQHLVWKNLEIARQKKSLQLQKEQEAKFNKQLEAFNRTLEEYDKKIADYQVRLSESDKKNPANRAKAEEASKYEKK